MTPATFTPSKQPRFTYHDWLLGSSIGQACTLVLIFLCLNLVGTLSWWLFDDDTSDLASSAWMSFTMIIDTGTIAGLECIKCPRGLLFVGVFLACSGVLFQLTVFGAVVGNLHSALSYLRRERSYDALSQHTLVLGWSEKTLLLLLELQRHAIDLQQDCLVLIVASREASAMKQEILDHLKLTRSAVSFQVLCRTGSPCNPNVLYRMSATTAERIIVLGHDPASLDVVRTMVAIGTLPSNLTAEVFVEAQGEAHALALEALLPGRTRAVWVKPTVCRVLALVVLDPVLVSCFLQFLFDLQQVPCPAQYVGQPFRRACKLLKTGLCVGVMRPGNGGPSGALFAPPRDLLLCRGDNLLVLQLTDDVSWIGDEAGGEWGQLPGAVRATLSGAARPLDALVDDESGEVCRVERRRLTHRSVRQDGGLGGRAARAVDPLMVRGTRPWTWKRPWAAAVGLEAGLPRGREILGRDLLGPTTGRRAAAAPAAAAGGGGHGDRAPCILVASGADQISEDLRALLQSLDSAAPPGTEVHALLKAAGQPQEGPLKPDLELRNIRVKRCDGDRTSLLVLRSLDLLQYHYILVLGDEAPEEATYLYEGSRTDNSDAECLFCSSTLTALLRKLEESAGSAGAARIHRMPQIICEVLDNQTIQMLAQYNSLSGRASFFFRHYFEAALFAYATVDWGLHNALTELLQPNKPRPLGRVPCAAYLLSEGERVSFRALADRVLERDGHVAIGCHGGQGRPKLYAGAGDMREPRTWYPTEELLVVKCNSEVSGWEDEGMAGDSADEDWRGSGESSSDGGDRGCYLLEYMRSASLFGDRDRM